MSFTFAYSFFIESSNDAFFLMKRNIDLNKGESYVKNNKGELSLRGRRLKGKGKGVLNARGASRVSLAPKTPFPFPFKRLPRRLRRTNTAAKRTVHEHKI